MILQNDKISIRQLQILLILDVFGTGVIVLPRRAAEYAGQDAWLVIAISTLAALICSLLMTYVGKLFPGRSFLDYTSAVLSKPAAFIISLLFAVKIILNISFELRIFAEIVKQLLLPETPVWLVVGVMLLLGAYAASKGYEVRARIAEILIFVVFVPLIIVFCIGAASVDFSNLLPVLSENKDPLTFLRGGLSMSYAFTGLEFSLLAFPYIQTKGSLKKGVAHAVLIIGALMLITTVITISQFGAVNIKRQMWPVLEMMNIIAIPGSFIENQDALIISFWIISVFAISNAGFFFSSLILKDIFKRPRHSVFIVLCAPAVFLLSLIPKDIAAVYEYSEVLFRCAGGFFLFALPLLLAVVAKLRGLGGAGR